MNLAKESHIVKWPDPSKILIIHENNVGKYDLSDTELGIL